LMLPLLRTTASLAHPLLARYLATPQTSASKRSESGMSKCIGEFQTGARVIITNVYEFLGSRSSDLNARDENWQLHVSRLGGKGRRDWVIFSYRSSSHSWRIHKPGETIPSQKRSLAHFTSTCTMLYHTFEEETAQMSTRLDKHCINTFRGIVMVCMRRGKSATVHPFSFLRFFWIVLFIHLLYQSFHRRLQP